MSWTQSPGQHLTGVTSVGVDGVHLHFENPPTPEFPWRGRGRHTVEVTVYGFNAEEQKENRATLVRLLTSMVENWDEDKGEDGGASVPVAPPTPPVTQPPVEVAVATPTRETFEIVDPTLIEEEARLMAAMKDG